MSFGVLNFFSNFFINLENFDIWHVYIDKEVKHGNIPEARKLFQRLVSSSKLSAKNMKTIFKKFLNFENAHGTAETQESVKTSAKQYVERLMV